MRTHVWVLLLGSVVFTGCPGDKESGTPADDSDPGGETGEPCEPTDEVCDGVDNDCDGAADEDLPTVTYFPDEDGDGYGDDDGEIEACEAPPGALTSGGDCDDDDATVRPGVPELCDGVDNDCDGRTDDADTNVDGQYTVYVDEDGDGFGVEPAFLFCEVPDGYATEAGDCDDENSRVVTYTWYRDADGDEFGMDGEIEACEQPEGYAVNNRDCDDDEALANPSLDEICADGIDNDCDGTNNDCVPYEGLVASSSAGASIDSSYTYIGLFNSAGDTDGDGIREVILASPYAGSYSYGAIYVHESLDDGSAHLDGSAIATVYDTTGAYLGWSGTVAGDVDGDGYDDLLAYDNNDNVWVGDGPFASSETFSAATYVTMTGGDADTSYYGALDGADLDGDGLSDLILGAANATSSYSYEGFGCVVTGASVLSGYKVTELASACVWGGSSGAYAGRAVAALGDIDGDGLREVGVAAPYYATSSATYTGALAVFDTDLRASVNLSDADLLITGSYTYDYLGMDVAGDGDADGDGYADILVSAEDDVFYSYGGGAAYLYYGVSTLGGTVTATAADAVMYSTAKYSFGQHLTWAGDMDADGADEIVAADYTDSSYSSYGGVAYLYYGPPSTRLLDQADADATFYGSTTNAYFGLGAAGAGDLDGDGYDDLMIGEYRTSTVQIFFGATL